MTLVFFLLLLLIPPASTCGEWWQDGDCIDDPRYDAEASNDLADQSDIWVKMPGLWIGDLSFYNGEGEVMPASFYDDAYGYGWPYDYGQYKGFINISVRGTRFYQHNVFLYPAADVAFCNQTVPEGKRNAFGAGLCGVNGGAKSFEAFGTSSYEKDGSMVGLPGIGSYGAFVNIARPIDGNTLLYTSTDDSTQFHSQTNVFYPDDAHRTRTAYGFMLAPAPGMPAPENPLYYSSLYRERKVSEEEWLAKLAEAYALYKVPVADQVANVPAAGDPACLVGTHAGATPASECPGEADWCKQDPACSTSPYQQPDASLNVGAIVGIVLACAFVVALLIGAGAYVCYTRRMRTIQLGFVEAIKKELLSSEGGEASASGATNVDLLHKLHGSIDTDSTGAISRDEMWAYLKEKGIELSRRDFNLFFAAIDTNKSGKVNPIEFAGFLAGKERDALSLTMSFTKSFKKVKKFTVVFDSSTRCSQPDIPKDGNERTISTSV